MAERCSFADRNSRKSLIFQLLVILEQPKGLKQGSEGFNGILKFNPAYKHYSRSDFRGQFNETII